MNRLITFTVLVVAVVVDWSRKKRREKNNKSTTYIFDLLRTEQKMKHVDNFSIDKNELNEAISNTFSLLHHEFINLEMIWAGGFISMKHIKCYYFVYGIIKILKWSSCLWINYEIDFRRSPAGYQIRLLYDKSCFDHKFHPFFSLSFIHHFFYWGPFDLCVYDRFVWCCYWNKIWIFLRFRHFIQFA